MKKLMIAVLTMALSGALWADSTYAFTYQAALRDEHGNVIMKDGELVRNHLVTVRLWDAPAGGERLWSRSFNVMTDTNGVFNLAVSDNGGEVSGEKESSTATLASVLAKKQAGDVYIGLEVENSAGEIGPRQRLFAVPFAAVANDVRKISKDVEVGGQITLLGTNSNVVVVSAAGITQKTGSSIFHELAVNDKLSVGGSVETTKGITVNGSEGLTVAAGPVTAKNGLTVEGSDGLTVTDPNGSLTVNSGLITATKDLTVNSGKLVVNADLEMGGGKSLKVGGAEIVSVPVGGIILWNSQFLPDNTHWAICDGKNGTPDLRDRFIVGAGKEYSLGNEGGEKEVKLTVEQLPKHRHGFNRGRATTLSPSGSGTDLWARDSWTSPATTDEAGGDQAHENRPPYYALYYIMRIK